jgi:hypothetical protein
MQQSARAAFDPPLGSQPERQALEFSEFLHSSSGLYLANYRRGLAQPIAARPNALSR